MLTIILVFLGGMAGGLLRHALSHILGGYWGTFIANTLACFLIGLGLTPAMSIGVAGALSTWSTLAKELGMLIDARRYALFSGYLLLTLTAGLLALHTAHVVIS
ncbi:hypothetical membrane protein [Corynebacterium kutscheri]|uniref:Fluoride-specific ion channel FluC n=1 Tax=Corynebacterium kutscheri TaxID=35755 RepID=A0A0F6R147_9CORY|nr:CrcB family protein [Corynebacterium kutscheri]AKE40813.1 Integral membrane protein [Corynebacterium kutscheri]VEH06508.1 hypothetical membrane protein [Corynebacterium kutscheri]VEH09110.1 hypothetical membrane protein [Corynebacterium kutscheri]VEH82427.1 hypothetical membrane protein [Corynebacterium kutscheri]